MNKKYIYGIDVSKYQGDIDWQKVFDDDVGALLMGDDRYPIKFAFARATMGKNKIDENFIANFNSIHTYSSFINYDFTRGAYHFMYSTQDGVEQCNHFVQTVNKTNAVLRNDIFILDAETKSDSVSMSVYIKRVEAFIKHFKYVSSLRYNTLYLYSGMHFMNTVLLPHLSDETLNLVKPWIARYVEEHPEENEKRPSFDRFKKEPFIWQFSQKGKINGIAGDVDCNIIEHDNKSKKALFFDLWHKFLTFFTKYLNKTQYVD